MPTTFQARVAASSSRPRRNSSVARVVPACAHMPAACYFRMLTARAITSAVVDSAIKLCSAISSLAHRDSGIVSVGQKASR